MKVCSSIELHIPWERTWEKITAKLIIFCLILLNNLQQAFMSLILRLFYRKTEKFFLCHCILHIVALSSVFPCFGRNTKAYSCRIKFQT